LRILIRFSNAARNTQIDFKKSATRCAGPALLALFNQGGGIPVSVIASINERRSQLVDILDGIERSLGQLESVL
jgi:hypothetical protein